MDTPDSRSNSNLNQTSADAPPAHAAAVDSAAASLDSSSASSSGPLTLTTDATTVIDRQASSHTPVTTPAGSLASRSTLVAESLSGRKRTADCGSVSSAAERTEAATSSVLSVLTSSVDPSSDRESQSKKPRGEPAHSSHSPAPAAVSAGFESMPATQTSSASSASFSTSDHRRAESMSDVPSLSRRDEDERKEQSQRSGSAASAVSAASGCSSSPAPQSLHAGFVWLQIDRLFRSALALIKESIPLVDSELQRYEEHQVPWVAEGTALRDQMEADLALLAEGSQSRMQGQAILGQIVNQLASHSEFVASRRSAVVSLHASAVKMQPPGPGVLLVLSLICTTIFSLSKCAVTFSPSQAFRAWVVRVDAVFTQIASLLPLVDLTAMECDKLMRVAMHSGSLPLILAIARQKHMHSGCEAKADPLGDCCSSFGEHGVSQLAHLRLFEYGLDPTTISKRAGPSSALQMARDFVREHPAPVVDAAESVASVAAAVGSAPLSILGAWAMQQMEPTEEKEERRRKALQAQFMYALISPWRAHSDKVLSLLSSPSVLIPDLAVIVGRYLDLEGLPIEPVVSVDEDGAEAESVQ